MAIDREEGNLARLEIGKGEVNNKVFATVKKMPFLKESLWKYIWRRK